MLGVIHNLQSTQSMHWKNVVQIYLKWQNTAEEQHDCNVQSELSSMSKMSGSAYTVVWEMAISGCQNSVTPQPTDSKFGVHGYVGDLTLYATFHKIWWGRSSRQYDEIYTSHTSLIITSRCLKSYLSTSDSELSHGLFAAVTSWWTISCHLTALIWNVKNQIADKHNHLVTVLCTAQPLWLHSMR